MTNLWDFINVQQKNIFVAFLSEGSVSRSLHSNSDDDPLGIVNLVIITHMHPRHWQPFSDVCRKIAHAIDKKMSSTINKILIDKL